MTDEKETVTDDQGRVWLGLLLCWICNIVQVGLGFVLILASYPRVVVGIVIFGGVGLVQLAYVVPLCLHYKKLGQRNVVKGLIIAASITALLNASCWGGIITRTRF